MQKILALCTHIIVVSCVLAPAVSAQSAKRGTTPPKNVEAVPPIATDAMIEIERRRSSAVFLLLSLASDAETFTDVSMRVEVIGKVASEIWRVDPDRAEALFLRAWDAATLADAQSASTRDTKADGNLRESLLQVIAGTDSRLVEKFLARYQDPVPGPAELAVSDETTRSQAYSNDAADTQRLNVASILLEKGQIDRALAIADPTFSHVSLDVVLFLTKLRERNAPKADERFGRLLGAAVADPESDANTTLTLSSYVLTPYLFVNVTESGALYWSRFNNLQREGSGEPLQIVFFKTAYTILIRQPPDGDAAADPGLAATQYAMLRFLPGFTRYVPHLVATVENRLAVIAAKRGNLTPSDKNITFGFDRQVSLERPDARSLAEEIDRIDRENDPKKRDELLATAAVHAAARHDGWAEKLADRIGESELRRQVRRYTDISAISQYLEAKTNLGEVERLANSGYLAGGERIWAISRLAQLVAPSDPQRASTILDEAARQSQQLFDSDPDKARALVCVATCFLDVDRKRSLELLYEAVRAINRSPVYTGTNEYITVTITHAEENSVWMASAREFELEPVFASVARHDYDAAEFLAKSIEGDAPRAAAILAVARQGIERPSTQRSKETGT